MNVKQLKDALANLPDEMEVCIYNYEEGSRLLKTRLAVADTPMYFKGDSVHRLYDWPEDKQVVYLCD
jgi:hypothetical protein